MVFCMRAVHASPSSWFLAKSRRVSVPHSTLKTACPKTFSMLLRSRGKAYRQSSWPDLTRQHKNMSDRRIKCTWTAFVPHLATCRVGFDCEFQIVIKWNKSTFMNEPSFKNVLPGLITWGQLSMRLSWRSNNLSKCSWSDKRVSTWAALASTPLRASEKIK